MATTKKQRCVIAIFDESTHSIKKKLITETTIANVLALDIERGVPAGAKKEKVDHDAALSLLRAAVAQVELWISINRLEYAMSAEGVSTRASEGISEQVNRLASLIDDCSSDDVADIAWVDDAHLAATYVIAREGATFH